MRGGVSVTGGADWLGRAAAAALLAAALGALVVAARLGAAAGADGADLLAELRLRSERRVAAEREQIRSVLDLAAGGDREGARREAEAALPRLDGNAQLHLFLAAAYRERAAVAPALHEYRRAVSLVRDLADRRSPLYIGATLAPWLRQVRPAVDGVALGDLHFLERSLAGGCT